jgi:transcriptional regulator with XRE-family HTH domain
MMTSPTAHDLELLGTAIRGRRRAAGLTLEDVAELVGVSAGQLSRIETGKSPPSYRILVRLQRELDLEPSTSAAVLPRPAPEHGLTPRLGALLTVRRMVALGEASVILGASITGIRAAVAELAERLAPLGMLVVEDRDVLGLVPHRAFVGIADRATAEVVALRLTDVHVGIIGIVLHEGSVTRRRIERMRGLDSAEAIAQLVEWGLLRRQGTDGRSPLYQVTAKLLEVTGTASLEELRQRFFEHLPATGDAS